MPGPTRPLPITEPRKLAAALRRLDERERRVLELRYGLGGERQHVLAEVGRLLGVSRERARQLETKALQKLSAQGARRPPAPGPAEHPAFLKSFVRPGTLFSLQSGPAHGYELRQRLRARGFESSTTASCAPSSARAWSARAGREAATAPSVASIG